jgi:membrane protease YdiL (CAAX protease family)
MNTGRIFIVDGRLRPIWRFFLSLVLLFAAVVVAGAAVGSVYRALRVRPELMAAMFWGSLAALAAVLAAFKLLTAIFERRPLGSVGLAFHDRWGRELGHGLAVGGVMIFLVVVLERACGLVHFSYAPHPVLRAASLTFVVLAVAAINEEAIFRGYPFQRLVESITPVGAIAVTSALFGLGHLGNPHHTWISTTNTMLVGIPFAIAYLRTRSLWMPIGIHFIWNFLLGFLLGLPVSGLTFPLSVFQARVHGAAWLTGAEYGPEGGLLATGVIVAATVYLSLSKRIYTSEEMKALVFDPVPSRGRDRPAAILAPASPEEQKRT